MSSTAAAAAVAAAAVDDIYSMDHITSQQGDVYTTRYILACPAAARS